MTVPGSKALPSHLSYRVLWFGFTLCLRQCFNFLCSRFHCFRFLGGWLFILRFTFHGLLRQWTFDVSCNGWLYVCGNMGFLWLCTDVWITFTLSKHIGDHLFLTRGFRLIVDQNIPIGFFGFFNIRGHIVFAILSKYSLSNIPICFRSLGLWNNTKYCVFRLISVLYFPLWNIFWRSRITLALRCLPWVTNFDNTGLSVAWLIKSSNTKILLYSGLISWRSLLRSGNPWVNRILFLALVLMHHTLVAIDYRTSKSV